jgi:hypothetical protein
VKAWKSTENVKAELAWKTQISAAGATFTYDIMLISAGTSVCSQSQLFYVNYSATYFLYPITRDIYSVCMCRL